MTEVVPKEDLDEVQVQMEEEEEEENQPSIYSRIFTGIRVIWLGESVHLGLGDFIFYSLLVTTAGYYSIVPYIACFVIIIAVWIVIRISFVGSFVRGWL